MLVEQAIYTSLPRGGREGYHVVSRSPGVSDADAQALARWSPSHGALCLDEWNRVSVNFHPLSEGRFALSRSCEGRPEYSGRGGRQVYTHALIFDASLLGRPGCSPLTIYRDALALGHFLYQLDPEPDLEPVQLGQCHRADSPPCCADIFHGLAPVDLDGVRRRLADGGVVQLRFKGDRLLLAECLLPHPCGGPSAPPSFSTGLITSSARPYQLAMFSAADLR